jgi:hypothetical protein
MPSTKFNELFDTSRHGPPDRFKDAGVVSDSLKGVHNAMAKCLFIVNRSCIHRRVKVFPHVKIQRIQVWRGAWRPCSGSSSTYPSVMIVLLRTSRTAWLKYAGSPSSMYYFRPLTASVTSSSRVLSSEI